MVELLQELRILQIGVQIIFAFLLTIAFAPRFPQLSSAQRYVYVATLLLSLITLAVLATPVAIHRHLFHRGVKEEIVNISARCALLGLFFLAADLACAVFLIIDVVLGRIPAFVITCCVAAAFLGLWFVVPRILRRQ